MTAQSSPNPSPGSGRHLVADQSEVLAFLTTPAAYGFESGRIERIDTHGAAVFLAGARAYKLKRAVRFSYMDFSTLEKRREACEKEIALNRRTAPELYLGVEPVARGADGTLRLGGPGETVEWLVVMRRFDQAGLFDRLAESGRLSADLVARLADAIAAFHQAAEPLSGAAAGGGSTGLGAVIEENFEELAERPDLFPPEQVETLQRAARDSLGRNAALLDRRLAEGFVRRCHGDLHLRNICLIDGKPTLFDAIEFNDAIACIDVLYDLAFLLMDLEHRDLRPFANLVLNRIRRSRADITGLAALPLFLSTRAAVRAKVSVSMAAAHDDAAAVRRLEAEAQSYFQAAQAYLAPEPVRLVALGGLSGSGKTSLGRALAPELCAAPGALHLRSDVLRKQLAGVGETARLPESAYDAASSAAVYGELLARARLGLAAGRTVIADAVFAQPAERAAIEALAIELGVPFVGLWLEAPEPVLVARVNARHGDASDANAAVVQRQLTYETGAITWHRLKTGDDLERVVAAARRLLARQASGG